MMNRPGPSQATSMSTGRAYRSSTQSMAPQSQGLTISPPVPSPGGVGPVGGPQQSSTPSHPQPPSTKVTRPSIAIQSHADMLLHLVKNEKAKLEKAYQDNLHRLEAHLEDHKRRADEEREIYKRRDQSLAEEIARLRAEVEELREGKADIMRALEEADMEFVDGGVKPRQASIAGASNSK